MTLTKEEIAAREVEIKHRHAWENLPSPLTIQVCGRDICVGDRLRFYNPYNVSDIGKSEGDQLYFIVDGVSKEDMTHYGEWGWTVTAHKQMAPFIPHEQAQISFMNSDTGRGKLSSDSGRREMKLEDYPYTKLMVDLCRKNTGIDVTAKYKHFNRSHVLLLAKGAVASGVHMSNGSTFLAADVARAIRHCTSEEMGLMNKLLPEIQFVSATLFSMVMDCLLIESLRRTGKISDWGLCSAANLGVSLYVKD